MTASAHPAHAGFGSQGAKEARTGAHRVSVGIVATLAVAIVMSVAAIGGDGRSLSTTTSTVLSAGAATIVGG